MARIIALAVALAVAHAAAALTVDQEEYPEPVEAPPGFTGVPEDTCGHAAKEHLHGPHPLWTADIESDEVRARGVSSEALGTWTPLRVATNFSLSDDPLLDKAPGGTFNGCPYDGCLNSYVVARGQDPNKTCVGGVQKYIKYCRLICEAVDVPTADERARLKEAVEQVASYLGRVLRTQADVGGQGTTVLSDKLRPCNDMTFGATHYPAADFVVYVTMRPLIYLGPAVLATASACAEHRITGRPVLANINVAPKQLKQNLAPGAGVNLTKVLLHEVTHALGFTSSMLSRYRFPSGNREKTYHQHDATKYPSGPVTGDGVVFDKGTAAASGGNFTIDTSLLGPGKKIYFTGPNVVAHARTHYSCDAIGTAAGPPGVELENGATDRLTDNITTARHWEKRVLFTELMTGQTNTTTAVFSAFTLSLLHDTGFYTVQDIVANEIGTNTWGLGGGCDWIRGDCGTAWTKQYRCDEIGSNAALKSRCSYDGLTRGGCSLLQYQAALPVGYQHFTNPVLGGSDMLADRCPVVLSTGRIDDMCTMGVAMNVNETLQYGAQSGDSGRCFETQILNRSYAANFFSDMCFPVVCDARDAANPGTATAAAYVKVGKRFFPCEANNDVFEMRLPEALRGGNAAAPSVPHWFVSADYAGRFQCGPSIAFLCRSPAAATPLQFGTGGGLPTTATVANWVALNAVAPGASPYDGSGRVNISGLVAPGVTEDAADRLLRCTVYLGGAPLRDVKKINATTVEGLTTAVVLGQTGGYNPGGAGPVEVELACPLGNDLCPQTPGSAGVGKTGLMQADGNLKGCVLSRLRGVFNYTEPVPESKSAEDAVLEFLVSPGGIVLLAIGGIVLLLVCLCLVHLCFRKNDDHIHKGGTLDRYGDEELL